MSPLFKYPGRGEENLPRLLDGDGLSLQVTCQCFEHLGCLPSRVFVPTFNVVSPSFGFTMAMLYFKFAEQLHGHP